MPRRRAEKNRLWHDQYGFDGGTAQHVIGGVVDVSKPYSEAGNEEGGDTAAKQTVPHNLTGAD
jgi:hypothetical protein